MFTYIPIKESCRYVEIKLPKLISYQRKGNHSPWWPNWIKVFKNGHSKICGRQSLKKIAVIWSI